jgi:hypothetical protein
MVFLNWFAAGGELALDQPAWALDAANRRIAAANVPDAAWNESTVIESAAQACDYARISSASSAAIVA